MRAVRRLATPARTQGPLRPRPQASFSRVSIAAPLQAPSRPQAPRVALFHVAAPASSFAIPKTFARKYSYEIVKDNSPVKATDNAPQASSRGTMDILDERPDGTKFAEINFQNGDKYVGEVSIDHKRHGTGAYWYASGSKYIGDFENDELHGEGEFLSANGDQYNGAWQHGKQHGYGTYVLAKGGKYEGEWENGTRHGTGTYYYPDGVRVYRGEWKHNVKHGRGTFTYENGDKYDGEWVNGKQHGKGVTLMKNGSIHQSDWRDGKPVGQGRIVTADGQVLEAEAGEAREQ